MTDAGALGSFVVVAFISIVLGGCGGAGEMQTQAINNVNIVEPGDTTLTCPQLAQEITRISNDLTVAQQTVQSQTQAAAMEGAARAVMPVDPYAGAGGAGQLLAAVSSMASAAGQTQANQDRDRMFRLEGRRGNLVNLYNGRCIGKVEDQLKPRKS